MSTVHHGIRLGVKIRRAAGGVAAFVAVCEAAHVIYVLAGGGERGTVAGVALVGAVFTACWLAFSVVPQLRHPAPAARPARGRDPEMITEPVALAGTAASR